MFNIGLPELLIIAAIALIVFGPNKLPELARAFGKAMREFRKATEEMKESFEAETRDLEELKDSFTPEKLLADLGEEDTSSSEPPPPGVGSEEAVTAPGGAVEAVAREEPQASSDVSSQPTLSPSVESAEREPEGEERGGGMASHG